MTDDLIDRLARDLEPVSSGTVERRLGLAALAGASGSAVAMAVWLGIRPDLDAAISSTGFWVKAAYTLTLGILGAWASSRLARPGDTGRLPLFLAVAALGVLAVAAGASYVAAPVENRHALVMGSSALVCPIYILALSVPLLLAAFAFMRRMAPTNLGLAGLSAGLMAGGLAASIYALHCTEQALPFVALWYTAGIASAAIIGAAAGRHFLRW